jgi:hypothetical protein
MNKSRHFASFVITSACLALAGCGGEEVQEDKAAVPTERSIFVSAVDCEASGKITIEDCSKAIEKAIRVHDKTSPTYKSLDSCEETEGAERCERVADRIYRPRLAAYVFDNTTPPAAKPLYLIADGAAGFRNADKEVLLGKDDNLIFSKSAQDLYELYVGVRKKK